MMLINTTLRRFSNGRCSIKIALISATGHVGHYFLNKALQRGHTVTALVRDPSKLAAHDGLYTVQADVNDPAQVTGAVADHEVVISAFNGGWDSAGLRTRHAAGSQAILDDVRRSGMSRLLVLGGVGNLEIAPGQHLVGSPEFPGQWKQGTLGATDALDQLRGEQRLDWVFLSPVILLEPGQRSGKFRLDGGQVLFGARGENRISLKDLAVVMPNEAKQPRHHRQRSTVAC